MEKRKEQDLPVIKILESDFRVHLREGVLQQVDNLDNRIRLSELKDNGNHMVVVFDPLTKNAFTGSWKDFMERKDVVMVRLPSLVNLDREGLREIIRERGVMDFLSRNDRLSFFKDFERPVSEESSKRKGKAKGI